MIIQDVADRLTEVSGIEKFKEILKKLTDKQISELVNIWHSDEPNYIKGVAYSGYIKQRDS